MIGNKVKYYVSRQPKIVSEGLIVDKVILKEFDVGVTGYLIEDNSELKTVKCWDLIKVI